MKAIVLAAGRGTRLAPYTDSVPKCMVNVCGKSILDYQLDVFREKKIDEIVVVAGYKNEQIKYEQITKIINPMYETTNMVYSLFCARDCFDDDIIISYGDIIYSKGVFDTLLNASGEFSVVVDKEWQKLWQLRMENPLDDVETMIIDGDKIVELGKKPTSLDDVQGQYIGLIKIRKSFLPRMLEYYLSLDRNKLYDGQCFENMYLTSFIQLLINRFDNVTPTYIHGEWAEVDSVSDLNIYLKNNYIHSFLK